MRFLKALLIIAIVLAAAYGVLALVNGPRGPHPYYSRLGAGPLVLAHGGGQGLWPDNTMRAFTGSAALGADVLELDVQRDGDGAFRVIHDATVDRTTDGTGLVSALRAAQVEALDDGYRWTISGNRPSGQDGDFPYRGQGVAIPTLAEVLAGFPDSAVNIEIKEEVSEAGTALCELLHRTGSTGRVLVASFNSAPMKAFRQACPEVATSATRSEVTLFYVLARARLSAVYTPPFVAVQVPVQQGSLTVVTPHFIQAAHARGVKVEVWTVNESAEMRRLLDMGVDGLITDRPDRAMAVLGRRFDAGIVPDFVLP